MLSFMEKGILAYTGIVNRVRAAILAAVLAGLAITFSAPMALAADAPSGPVSSSAQTALSGLRTAGSGAVFWPDSAYFVQSQPAQSEQKSVSIILHFVDKPLNRAPSQPRSRALQRYTHGESHEHWYALAGAGSGALILLPGEVIETDGLRLQRRAKIGKAQLGIARDFGPSRVTLGYLRHNTDRNDLVPYNKVQKRQNLAALTLSFKH